MRAHTGQRSCDAQCFRGRPSNFNFVALALTKAPSTTAVPKRLNSSGGCSLIQDGPMMKPKIVNRALCGSFIRRQLLLYTYPCLSVCSWVPVALLGICTGYSRT